MTDDKLVRDLIPQLIRKSGRQAEIRHLAGADLVAALGEKLCEEAREVADVVSDREELVAELADVYEVMSALMKRSGITESEVIAAAQAKALERGGFDQGVWLVAVSSDASNLDALRADETGKDSGSMVLAEFSDEVYALVATAVEIGTPIYTLTIKRPNWIAAIDRTGVWVETERSRRLGSPPQLVPAWMIETGWEHLTRAGELSQKELLNTLNVKRSAFVCALLAQFPDVVVRDMNPTVLEFLRGVRAN